MRKIAVISTGLVLAVLPLLAWASDYTGVVMTFWTIALLVLSAVLALVHLYLPPTIVWKAAVGLVMLPLLAALAFSGQGLFPRYPVAGTAYWASWVLAVWLTIRILRKRLASPATDGR